MVREKPQLTDIVGALGGLLLAVSVFVKAYETRPENPNAQIDGMGGPNPAPGITPGDGTYSIWAVNQILRFLLLAAAVAPLILLWVIIRQHELSWPRGEMTAVVGLTAATLVFYVGIVDRPGEPSGEIELEIGWYGCMLGALVMTVCGALRATESGRKRKPPGVL